MMPRETTLDNGLRIVTENRQSLQSLSIGLWASAGARHERSAQSGLAHCLEHMVFKGTKTRSARDIAFEIERVGGHLNAYTTRDHTCFYARTLSEDLPLAVSLLADLTQNPLLDADELENEKEVILQELGQAEDTPDDIIFDELQAVAYKDQPLGRSILGTEDTIKGLTVRDVGGFLSSYYRPENLVIAAVGKIDHDALVAEIDRAFGHLTPLARPADQAARFHGGHWAEDRALEQVHLALAFEGMSYHDSDYYAQQVYSTILGGGMSSRLFQEVREKQGLAYSVYSFAASHADTGLFGIYAGTAPERFDALVKTLRTELARMPGDITEDELVLARAQLKAGLIMGLESTGTRMEQLGRQLLLFDRLIPIEEMVAEVDGVTLDRTRALADRFARPERVATAVIGQGNYSDFRY